jgi:hypothetical protein
MYPLTGSYPNINEIKRSCTFHRLLLGVEIGGMELTHSAQDAEKFSCEGQLKLLSSLYHDAFNLRLVSFNSCVAYIVI